VIVRVGGTLAVTAALAHAGPALTSLTPMRRRLLPALAGVGHPDHVALTFDDGPSRRSTPLVLDFLAEHHVHATFFLLGRELVKDRALGHELVAAGHELAVHGWDHQLLLKRGPRATLDDITRAHDLIGEVAGRSPRWYRPPHGVLTTAAAYAAEHLSMRTVLWTAWGRDWRRRATAESVAATVTQIPAAGGTILLHDSDTCSAPNSWVSTLEALPTLLAHWQHQNLKVGPLHEHGHTP